MKGDERICGNYGRDFCDRLRFLRNEKNISAREMSIALGQNVNYINLIENGKRFPSIQGFFSICEYLSITPADFFNFSKNTPVPSAMLQVPPQEEICDILSRLTESQSSAVLLMLKSFV